MGAGAETLELPPPARWRSRPDRWAVAALGLALLVSIPVITVLGSLLVPAGEVWAHLRATVLGDYIVNSLLLAAGVGAGTLVLGVGSAWLVAMCSFPGRRMFEWALLLPLAMPAYIIGYTYTGLLDYAGPVQSALRDWFGWHRGDYWFPELRSLGGAIGMLSLVLYPYVYMLARTAFLEQSVCVLEVSRSLGASRLAGIFRIALPLARPAIVVGVSLALMESLSDYGTVQYFGVQSFTTGIFKTWFGLGEPVAAAQLSAMLLCLVVALVCLERWSRSQARYHHTSGRYRALPTQRLKGTAATAAFLCCLVPVVLGFLLPAGQLFWWAVHTAHSTIDRDFLVLMRNSLLLAAAAALLTLSLAVFLGYAARRRSSPALRTALRLATSGYAVPGVVIAVGVMMPFAWFDNAVDAWMRRSFGWSTGLLLSGTLFALLFAYLVRFLAIAVGTVESGLCKIGPHLDEAARSLGAGSLGALRRVHLPAMRGTLIAAFLLVFVDVLKELPATLLLRPFNFNTLAVRTYELANDERLADASTAALAIVIVGIVPVVLLARSIARSRPGHDGGA